MKEFIVIEKSDDEGFFKVMNGKVVYELFFDDGGDLVEVREKGVRMNEVDEGLMMGLLSCLD